MCVVPFVDLTLEEAECKQGSPDNGAASGTSTSGAPRRSQRPGCYGQWRTNCPNNYEFIDQA